MFANFVCKNSYDLSTNLYLDYFRNALLRIQLGAWFDALKEPPGAQRQSVKTEMNWKPDLLQSKPSETDRAGNNCHRPSPTI